MPKIWVASRVFIFGVLIAFNGGGRVSAETGSQKTDEYIIFPQGQLGPAGYFTGRAWNLGLVPNDSIYTTVVGNVYFEPGARSNWHTHPSGQILIITDGVGYYQEKGTPKRMLRKGDVVKCPPDVMHWHGASPEKSLSQMYIVPNTEKGIVKWLHPVSDAEYNQ